MECFNFLISISFIKRTPVRSIQIVISFLLASTTVTAQTNTSTAFAPYDQNIPGSSVSFSLVPVPAGSFTMGSPATEAGRKPTEGPVKKVQLDAFWMGVGNLSR